MPMSTPLFPLRRPIANAAPAAPSGKLPTGNQYDPTGEGLRRPRRGLFGRMGRALGNDGDAATPNFFDWLMLGPTAPDILQARAQRTALFPVAVRREKLEQALAERELAAEPEAPVRYGPLEHIDGRLGQPNLNTGQYDWAPQVPAGSIYQPPAGYRGTPEGLEAIPGGPADLRATAEGRSRLQQLDSSDRQLSNALDVLDNDTDTFQNSSAGFMGGLLRGVPGTGAYDLNQALEPVRSILSFENLAEMRRNSTTGGALGSIAVRELELLGSTVRSLDTAQSPQQLARNLGAVRQQLRRTREAIRAARAEITGEGEDEAPTNDGSAPEQGRVRVWNPATGRLE